MHSSTRPILVLILASLLAALATLALFLTSPGAAPTGAYSLDAGALEETSTLPTSSATDPAAPDETRAAELRAGATLTVTPGGVCCAPDGGGFVTLAGDVIGPSNVNVVNGVSGSTANTVLNGVGSLQLRVGGSGYMSLGSVGSTITPLVSNLMWANSVAPNIGEASESTATQGASFTITPQQSTQATNQGGGSLLAAFETPLGTGTEAFFETTRGGAATTYLGVLVGSPTLGALYLGSATPTSSDYTIASSGTNVTVNGSNSAGLAVAGNDILFLTTALVEVTKPFGGTSGTNAFSWETTNVALTSGTGNVLSAAQYYAPHIKFTGALTGAGTTVTFPATDGACWDLDFSAVTTIADSIALIANGATWGTAVAGIGTEFPHVCYSAGVGRLVGTAMTE